MTTDETPPSPASPDVIESLPGGYVGNVIQLRSGGRRDVTVVDRQPAPLAFASTDIVASLRAFFDQLEREAQDRRDDPVQLTNGLVRCEAMLADLRYVTATVRGLLADALVASKVRRLTVEGLATVEGHNETDRTDWQHKALLTRLFRDWIMYDGDGVRVDVDEFTDRLLDLLRPEWKVNGIRSTGVNPDDYCTLPVGEDGKPLRKPNVRTVTNLIRAERGGR